VKNAFLTLTLLLFAASAMAKPKSKASREPAAPVRDTSLEDVEALDSVINASNPPPPPQKEELTRLAKLMLEKSPTVKVAFENWQIAQFNTKITQAQFLPAANISNTFGKKGLDPYLFPGPDNTYGNLTLSMNEVLYDNGVTLNTLDQNKKAQERLRLEYEYTRDLQLLAVTQAYMDWSQSLQSQQLDEAKRKILGRQYAFMDSQFHQGYTSRRDVLRLESEIRRVQLDTLSDESNVVVNRATLLDLLGATSEDLDKIAIQGEETGAVEEPGSGTDAVIKLSEHRRLKILRYREQEADINIRLAQRNYWPQLRLQADANYINDNYLQPNIGWGPNGYANWDALVIFSWTIWDWGIKKNNMEIARVNSGITADKDRQEELDLQVQLEQLMRKLIEFKTSLNLSQELMTLERQNYTSLENDYRSGKAGYLDLITSINDYIDARTRFMSAYFNLRKQKMTYQFHRGDLYKNLISE
jgi:outer membrane protein TolC